MTSNFQYKLAQLKSAIFGIDLDVVAAYQYKIPKSIGVEVRKEGKMFTGIVKSIDGKDLGSGFATCGRDEHELIRMVNDAVQTFLDIPPEVCIAMPLLIPEGYTARKKLSDRTVEFCRS